MKQRIEQCFNRSAKTYDAAAMLQASVAKRLSQRLPHVSPEKILEIGCGTGLFSEELLTKFPHASISLTDISPAMIDICKKRMGSSAQLEFACMDGEAISTQTSFDLIVSNMTLHWFADFKNSFANMISKLSPGGKIFFAMLGENSLREFREICQNLNLPVPTPNFPVRSDLQNDFPKMKIEVEVLLQPYRNIYDFLRTLKEIGATATRPNYYPLSAGNLRRVMREFNTEIQMSYEIIYGHYIK